MVSTRQVIRHGAALAAGILGMAGAQTAIEAAIGAFDTVGAVDGALPSQARSFAPLVRSVARTLDSDIGHEFREVGEASSEAVVERLAEIVSGPRRRQLLSAAFLGETAFRDGVLSHGVGATGRDILDGLDEDAQGYLTALIRILHVQLERIAQAPEIVGTVAMDAVRDILAAIPTESALRATVRSELDRLLVRPGAVIFGSRPALVDSFVERSELIELRRRLEDPGTVTVCAVAGLRGLGKSQLASAFAQQCERAGWTFVAWITANDHDEAVRQLANAAITAGVAPADADPSSAAQLLVTWLNHGAGQDRLLVFDNVEDADDIVDLMPRGDGLRVIVTTTSATGAFGTPLEIDEFDPDDAMRYLIETSGLDDPEGAQKVSVELGFHPLALTQAAAAIRAGAYSTYDEYLDALTGGPLRRAVRRRRGDPYPIRVDRALGLAIEVVLAKLANEDPELREAADTLLLAMPYLAEAGIPFSWALRAAEEHVARRTVGALIENYLIRPSTDGALLSLHRLQARVLRETYAAEDSVGLAVAAVERVFDTGFDQPTSDFMYRRAVLAEKVTQLAAIESQPHSEPLLGSRILIAEASYCIYVSILLHEPRSGLRLATYVDRLPNPTSQDSSALTARHNLASAYRAAGDLTRAIALHETNLANRKRILGPDHPDTLSSRNNLAYAYESASDLTRAIPLYEKTLADRERLLGPDHPQTLGSRNNLAGAYESAGDLSRAIPIYEKTLDDSERIQGLDHPSTLTIRNNLAYAYQAVGDFSRAIPLYEKTLNDRERIQGPDHPNTLTSRNNLAHAYHVVGDLARAIPLHEQTLDHIERILGHDHPDTLTSRNNLAGAYESAGDLTRAIPLYEKNLHDREDILGPDHAHTLTSRINLAFAYKSAGDLTRAIPLYERGLSDSERILGPNHPYTQSLRGLRRRFIQG